MAACPALDIPVIGRQLRQHQPAAATRGKRQAAFIGDLFKYQTSLAPQLTLGQGMAQGIAEMRVARPLLLGHFEALQPFRAKPRQGLNQSFRHGGALIGSQLGNLFPEGTQPATAIFRGAKGNSHASRASGNECIASIGRVQLLPHGSQLISVARCFQCLDGQRAQQALRGQL